MRVRVECGGEVKIFGPLQSCGDDGEKLDGPEAMRLYEFVGRAVAQAVVGTELWEKPMMVVVTTSPTEVSS